MKLNVRGEPYKIEVDPQTWDTKLTLRPKTSEYYAHLVRVYGQEMANYYWNRRHAYEQEFDYEYIKICREITAKSEAFLKKRGIKTKNLFTH